MGKGTVEVSIFGRKQAKAIGNKLFRHMGGRFLSLRKAKAPTPCEQGCSSLPGARNKLQAKTSCMLYQGENG